MKNILVFTDFSACASRATSVAIEIAKKSAAKIHFFHCKTVPFNWIHLTDPENKLYLDVTKDIKSINAKLQKLVKSANDADVEATYELCYNEDSDSILGHIRDHHIDFIVMGSHGAKGLKEVFIGSYAQKIVRHSEVPVLIIKKQVKGKLIPKVIFVSDFEPDMMTPFEKVLNFTNLIEAEIDLVYINTPNYFEESWVIKRKMKAFIERASDILSNSEVIDAILFETGIEKYCEQAGDGIIAMATYGRKGFSQFILGSLTEKVINHSELPVLSLRV